MSAIKTTRSRTASRGRVHTDAGPFRAGLFLCLALSLGGGCATRRPATETPVFFPPPPGEPRLQYLTHYTSPRDLESTPSALMTFLAGLPPAPPPILKPYGLALHDGVLYACDTVAGVIHMLDLEQRVWTPFKPGGPGTLRKVINIDVDKDGTRYVADTLRGQVLIFGPGGGLLGTLAEPGELKPPDVKVHDDRVYVADLKSHSLKVYDKATRQLLHDIPSDVQNEEQKLFSPTNLAVDDSGRVYVSDSGAFRVQLYDTDGQYLRSFGRHGDWPGEFARNKGIAVDRENRLYAVDAAFQNIQIFDEEGQILLHFAGPGSGPAELSLPAGLIVDYDHNEFFQDYVAPGYELEYLVLVTCQYGPRRVTVFGFIHPGAGTDADAP